MSEPLQQTAQNPQTKEAEATPEIKQTNPESEIKKSELPSTVIVEQISPEKKSNISPKNQQHSEISQTPTILRPIAVQADIGAMNIMRTYYDPQMYNQEAIKNMIYQKPKNLKGLSLNENGYYVAKEKPCCTCTKTRCKKKYCECFASGNFCIDCHCTDCMNKPNIIQVEAATSPISEGENVIICTCSKSNCNKKYCECFKLGLKCNEKCRCINCMNGYPKPKNSGIGNSYVKPKVSVNNDNSSTSSSDFKIQRISVFINDDKTSINVDKINKNEPTILNKKRKKEDK